MTTACCRETCRRNRTRLTGCFGQFTNLTIRFGERPIAQPPVTTEKAATCQSDAELWQLGVSAINHSVRTMPPPVASKVNLAIGELMALKRTMHAIVEAANGTPTCSVCGGMCCKCGKYHFTAIDLVAYLVTGRELFEPDFAGEGCCFLHRNHCLMPPDYRPFNCITFVCEMLEERFSGEEKVAFYALERELRRLYQHLQQYFPDPRMGRSVMSFCAGVESVISGGNYYGSRQ